MADQAQLLAAQALIELTDAGAVITVECEPIVAFTIIGQLQLALRHPNNGGQTRDIAIAVIEALAEQLGPAFADIVAAGYDETHDR